MTSDVARRTQGALNEMREAADRRLHRRFLRLRTIILLLLVVAVVLGWLAWPRITALFAQLTASSSAAPPATPSAAPSGPTIPPTGDALLVTGWAAFRNGQGDGVVGVQMMLRRATAASPGSAGVWFLYPAGHAPAAARTPVSFQGQNYVAVEAGPVTWNSGVGNLVVHADLTCAQDTPLTCSGTLTLDAPQTTAAQVTPAVVANAIGSDGTLRILSAEALPAAPQVSWCQIMPCG